MTTLRDYVHDAIVITVDTIEARVNDDKYVPLTEDEKEEILNDTMANIVGRLIGA